MDWESFEIVTLLVASLVAGLLGAHLVAVSKRERIRQLEAVAAQLDQRLHEQLRVVQDLGARHHSAEETIHRLRRSIAEMPEIAQRLTGTRDLREIPERTLDLIQEIFDASYSVFYRTAKDELVAVACRGESEFAVGHRVKRGEGIVGWTAVKQLPLTLQDAQLESGVVRGRNLATGVPTSGFALSLPIVNGERTIGVILIGPSLRDLPHLREIGRTIALITSVSMTSAAVLKEQTMLAKTDGLTGLLNKTHILRRLRDLIASDGGPRIFSVFLFDIDHFKHYNDTNGHLAGDELLRSLGDLLKENVREEEIVGRYGGEEFLLIMPNVEKSLALRAAERIRAVVAGWDFPHRDRQPGGCVTVSGGVAGWPNDGDEVDALLHRADQALYQAKREGRNRILAYAAPELAMGEAADPLAGFDPELEKPER
ncbi:MAG TPA: sensor domain-containing diguanylate cyclase [Myxococcota bacterium]|nr:sensor domain-containing diguanylate cyclase [Myxococcota bacterium]